MKKLYIYALAAVLGFAGVSCNSDEPADATSKHEYAKDESPYLRTNTAATATAYRVFNVSTIDEPQYINLKDYASYFHKNLDMTVDEVMTAFGNGEVVMYNINTSRQRWDLTNPNNGEYGWYYTTGGQVATGDASAAFSSEFDRENKRIILHAVNGPGAGTVTNLDLGFAKVNGKDFDDYVRFTIQIEVKDPSIVEVSGIVPAGDWAGWGLEFTAIDAELQAALGLTAKEFMVLWNQCEQDGDSRDTDPIQIFLLKNGERVVDESGKRPATTTNWMGWWLDADQNIVSFGDSSWIYLEGSETSFNFGRHPNVPSGETAVILVDFALTEDLNKHITFRVSLTFE